MKLYLVVYLAGQIVGVSGPFQTCPRTPTAIGNHEVRCEQHIKRPPMFARLASLLAD